MFDVRHSVFLLGNAGAGKSKVWNTLNRTYRNQGRKPQAIDLDPKAVTNNELFGIINPSTREWKDGKYWVPSYNIRDQTPSLNLIFCLLILRS